MESGVGQAAAALMIAVITLLYSETFSIMVLCRITDTPALYYFIEHFSNTIESNVGHTSSPCEELHSPSILLFHKYLCNSCSIFAYISLARLEMLWMRKDVTGAYMQILGFVEILRGN